MDRVRRCIIRTIDVQHSLIHTGENPIIYVSNSGWSKTFFTFFYQFINLRLLVLSHFGVHSLMFSSKKYHITSMINLSK